MPRKSLRRRRRRSSKKSKKTFTKQLTKRSKSKKIRGGVTTRNGVRRGNYRFLSTLKAQDLTRLPSDVFGEIREMHPLLTPKLNNSTLRHAVKDYLSSNVKIKRFIISKYGEIGDWDGLRWYDSWSMLAPIVAGPPELRRSELSSIEAARIAGMGRPGATLRCRTRPRAAGPRARR